jgi:hypothetical protein
MKLIKTSILAAAITILQEGCSKPLYIHTDPPAQVKDDTFYLPYHFPQ